jgi:hypothetical protein
LLGTNAIDIDAIDTCIKQTEALAAVFDAASLELIAERDGYANWK